MRMNIHRESILSGFRCIPRSFYLHVTRNYFNSAIKGATTKELILPDYKKLVYRSLARLLQRAVCGLRHKLSFRIMDILKLNSFISYNFFFVCIVGLFGGDIHKLYFVA